MDFRTFLLWLIGTGGGAAVVAWATIKALGTRWLDSQFVRRLQDLRHEHELGLEDLRFRSSQLMDRVTRFSAEEFKALPEAWGLVFDAYVATDTALARLGRFLDFDKSDEESTRRYLTAIGFEDWDIEAVLTRSARDRATYFHERHRVYQSSKARKALVTANVFLTRNALFIEKDIQDRLAAFLDMGFKALADWEFVLESRGEFDLPKQERADDNFRKQGETEFQALEAFVRERFNKASARLAGVSESH